MQKARLLKLADMLDEDAKTKKGIKFDMGTWGYITNEEEPLSCGTSACAMGLACLSGRFKRAGLSYDVYSLRWDVSSPIRITPIHTDKDGYRRYELSAAVALFGIPYRDAAYLFSSGSYTDANSRGARAERFVARRIREYVKRGKPPHNFRWD